MTKLVDNELCKLLANALDRLSTGCVLVGVFTTAISLAQDRPSLKWPQVLGLILWFFAALVLHLRAQAMIRRLTE